MTDNLKTRIAEAIEKTTLEFADSGQKFTHSRQLTDLVAKAVLDIVQPIMPKWMPIESLVYEKKHGYSVSHQVLLNEHHPETNINTFVLSRLWEEDGEITIIDARHRRNSERVTHFMPLPTPPEKE